MCYVSPFQGLGELLRRRAQVAGVPRVALRSTLGYLIMPRWGERSRAKNSGTVPGVFQFVHVIVEGVMPWHSGHYKNDASSTGTTHEKPLTFQHPFAHSRAGGLRGNGTGGSSPNRKETQHSCHLGSVLVHRHVESVTSRLTQREGIVHGDLSVFLKLKYKA